MQNIIITKGDKHQAVKGLVALKHSIEWGGGEEQEGTKKLSYKKSNMGQKAIMGQLKMFIYYVIEKLLRRSGNSKQHGTGSNKQDASL